MTTLFIPSPFTSTAKAADPLEMASAEFTPTPNQLKAITESCTANALANFNGEASPITPQQKDSLRGIIKELKKNVSQALDKIQASKIKNRNQIPEIQKELNELESGVGVASDFHRFFSPAIIACQQAAVTFQNSKTLTDRLFSRRIELRYRISLKKLLDRDLSNQVATSQGTIGDLDSILLLLG